MALLSSLGKYKDIGILVMRVGLGLAFMVLYGYPKLTGGPDMWKAVGGAMNNVGIDYYPVVWGFLAAITEALGGLLILLGLFFRPASLLISCTMLVAGMNHLAAGDGWTGASHSLELMVVFIALVFIGPGKYSVDKR